MESRFVSKEAACIIQTNPWRKEIEKKNNQQKAEQIHWEKIGVIENVAVTEKHASERSTVNVKKYWHHNKGIVNKSKKGENGKYYNQCTVLTQNERTKINNGRCGWNKRQ